MAKTFSPSRLICSSDCVAALKPRDDAMDLILQKSLESARASAFYSYLCAGLSAAGAVGAWFYLPAPFLIWFTAGCSAVFLVSGFWHGRIARQRVSGR